VPPTLSAPFFLNHLRMSPTFAPPARRGTAPARSQRTQPDLGPGSPGGVTDRSRRKSSPPWRSPPAAPHSRRRGRRPRSTWTASRNSPSGSRTPRGATRQAADGRAGAARRRGGRCVRRLHPADGHDPRPSDPCQGLLRLHHCERRLCPAARPDRPGGHRDPARLGGDQCRNGSSGGPGGVRVPADDGDRHPRSRHRCGRVAGSGPRQWHSPWCATPAEHGRGTRGRGPHLQCRADHPATSSGGWGLRWTRRSANCGR
jgi:hypothetical protein